MMNSNCSIYSYDDIENEQTTIKPMNIDLDFVNSLEVFVAEINFTEPKTNCIKVVYIEDENERKTKKGFKKKSKLF